MLHLPLREKRQIIAVPHLQPLRVAPEVRPHLRADPRHLLRRQPGPPRRLELLESPLPPPRRSRREPHRRRNRQRQHCNSQDDREHPGNRSSHNLHRAYRRTPGSPQINPLTTEAALAAAGIPEPPLVTSIAAPRAVIPQGVAVFHLQGREDLRPSLRHYPPHHPAIFIKHTPEGPSAEPSTVEAIGPHPPPNAAALVLPALDPAEIRDHAEGFRAVIDILRDPDDGCPWDLAQTHLSLRPHLLEETHEVLHALAHGSPAELCEELGDLFLQIVLHAKIAEQDGRFDLGDVAEGIRAKLVRRHPHVFASAESGSPEWIEGAWERLKAAERPERRSALDGVPRSLPALARAQVLLGRAERNGWRRPAPPPADLGDQALDLTQQAKDAGINLEDAARDALDRFETRVRRMEAALAADGRKLPDASPDELARLWNDAG